jgi:hypothetical protein
VTISVSGPAAPHGRQQRLLAGLDRHLVALAGVVAERAGQPAAAVVEHLVVEPEPVEHPLVAARVARRPLVAVHVHQRAAAQAAERLL